MVLVVVPQASAVHVLGACKLTVSLPGRKDPSNLLSRAANEQQRQCSKHAEQDGSGAQLAGTVD